MIDISFRLENIEPIDHSNVSDDIFMHIYFTIKDIEKYKNISEFETIIRKEYQNSCKKLNIIAYENPDISFYRMWINGSSVGCIEDGLEYNLMRTDITDFSNFCKVVYCFSHDVAQFVKEQYVSLTKLVINTNI